LLLVGLAVNALIVLPAWWRDGVPGSVWLAPEAWLLPATAALLPAGRGGAVVRAAMAGLLAFAVIAGIFDALVVSVLGRPLNVFIDPLMLGAGFHLIEGSLGFWAAVLASLIVAAAAFAVVWGAASALKPDAGRPAMVVLLVALALSLPPLQARLPGVSTQLPALAAHQVDQFERTRLARAALVEAQGHPEFEPRALEGLTGRDVYVVFVESYGASAIEQARFARTIRPLLDGWRQRLAAAGLSSVSAALEAPIRGGQSWLSHATVQSGLPIDNQLWYSMLLSRDIGLLADDFRATGHWTVNVAPAIVRDWPEGRQLGFDRVLAAAELGYEGPALGWVTMPDQFTLQALSEALGERPDPRRPVFAQVALISSHWPWQPVVDLVEPARMDDGRIYRRWAGRDIDAFSLLFSPRRLRSAYSDSLAYSLEATFDWAARSLPRDALLIVLGDHQPVSLVTGRDAGASVPVHVISADGEVLAAFARRGFVPGLLPAAVDDPPGLERLRHWLRRDFARPRENLP
jgi:hypothetical protein